LDQEHERHEAAINEASSFATCGPETQASKRHRSSRHSLRSCRSPAAPATCLTSGAGVAHLTKEIALLVRAGLFLPAHRPLAVARVRRASHLQAVLRFDLLLDLGPLSRRFLPIHN